MQIEQTIHNLQGSTLHKRTRMVQPKITQLSDPQKRNVGQIKVVEKTIQ
jgi:hypothetical protein